MNLSCKGTKEGDATVITLFQPSSLTPVCTAILQMLETYALSMLRSSHWQAGPVYTTGRQDGGGGGFDSIGGKERAIQRSALRFGGVAGLHGPAQRQPGNESSPSPSGQQQIREGQPPEPAQDADNCSKQKRHFL